QALAGGILARPGQQGAHGVFGLLAGGTVLVGHGALACYRGAGHATACGRPLPADEKGGAAVATPPLASCGDTAGSRSAAVAVGVARDRTLDVVPAIAHRMAGIVPG